jgi:hypothetical protein
MTPCPPRRQLRLEAEEDAEAHAAELVDLREELSAARAESATLKGALLAARAADASAAAAAADPVVATDETAEDVAAEAGDAAAGGQTPGPGGAGPEVVLDQRELPTGWSASVSRRSNDVYYIYEPSGESQWEHPADSTPAVVAPASRVGTWEGCAAARRVARVVTLRRCAPRALSLARCGRVGVRGNPHRGVEEPCSSSAVQLVRAAGRLELLRPLEHAHAERRHPSSAGRGRGAPYTRERGGRRMAAQPPRSPA